MYHKLTSSWVTAKMTQNYCRLISNLMLGIKKGVTFPCYNGDIKQNFPFIDIDKQPLRSCLRCIPLISTT
jgi:hypothetical protein